MHRRTARHRFHVLSFLGLLVWCLLLLLLSCAGLGCLALFFVLCFFFSGGQARAQTRHLCSWSGFLGILVCVVGCCVSCAVWVVVHVVPDVIRLLLDGRAGGDTGTAPISLVKLPWCSLHVLVFLIVVIGKACVCCCFSVFAGRRARGAHIRHRCAWLSFPGLPVLVLVVLFSWTVLCCFSSGG